MATPAAREIAGEGVATVWKESPHATVMSTSSAASNLAREISLIFLFKVGPVGVEPTTSRL